MSALYFRVPHSPVTPVLLRRPVFKRLASLFSRCTCCAIFAMTAQLVNCGLTSPSSPVAAAATATDSKKVAKLGQMDRELPIFSVMERHQEAEGEPAGKAADAESGISAGEGELCVEHEAELDWFCGTEQKLICSHCAIVGNCRGHSVTQLGERVTAVRVSAGGTSFASNPYTGSSLLPSWHKPAADLFIPRLEMVSAGDNCKHWPATFHFVKEVLPSR